MSTTAKQETDVLIVGDGPVGLTLGCELKRRSISCRLIDEYAEFPITSRALGLQARTLEVFDDMGVVEPIITQGAAIYGITFLQGEHTVGDRQAPPRLPYPPRPAESRSSDPKSRKRVNRL